jgi:hypothetical protein
MCGCLVCEGGAVPEPSKMAAIVRPRFVALDSSHLAAVARDRFSAHPEQVQKAKLFEESFYNGSCVPLLSWHHLSELLKHRDDAVVSARVKFIRSMPMVAWVSSLTSDEAPGTVADLLAHEVAAAFNMPGADVMVIRDEVAKRLFRFDSGERAVKPFMYAREQLQPELWKCERRDRDIVAVSRSDFVDLSKEKVVDLLKGRLRSPDDANQQLGKLRERLADDIRRRGDKRIPDAELSAGQFIGEVRRSATEAIVDDSNPGLQILRAQGIDPSDIGPNTTLGEACALATFRQKLSSLNLPWSELKARVTESTLPSLVIQSALRQYGQDTPERKGSDLADIYLACLSPYPAP